MSEKTAIQWTDHTFNIAWGCTKVSAGCANCYADRDASRYGFSIWGPGTERRTFGEKHWNEPRKWNRAAEKEGRRHRVFCSSMCDIFEDHPTIDAEREKLLDLVLATPWLDWQILTKRANRMWLWFNALYGIDARDEDSPKSGSFERNGVTCAWPIANVWLGTSIEDQPTADRRIQFVLDTPAVVRFVSLEPILGPVNLRELDTLKGLNPDRVETKFHPRIRHDALTGLTSAMDEYTTPALDWVIVGGESGPDARPCDVAWIRSIVEQCKAASVPVFVKQMGSTRGACPQCGHADEDHGFARTIGCQHGNGSERSPICGCRKMRDEIDHTIGDPYAHHPQRDHKGGDPSEWPEDLRVREFPKS